MFSEIFRFCSLSLLSGLFLVFASVTLFCSIWILLLEVFLSAVLVSRVSVAQTAPAPINLVTWKCSCPWCKALILGILPVQTTVRSAPLWGFPHSRGHQTSPVAFPLLLCAQMLKPCGSHSCSVCLHLTNKRCGGKHSHFWCVLGFLFCYGSHSICLFFFFKE